MGGEVRVDPIGWVIGSVVLMLALFSVVTGYLNHEETRHQQDCLVQVVKQQNQSLRARSGTFNASDEATRELLLSVPHLKTRAAFDKALAKYSATQRAIEAQRQAHPYPKFPSGKCS